MANLKENSPAFKRDSILKTFASLTSIKRDLLELDRLGVAALPKSVAKHIDTSLKHVRAQIKFKS